MTRYAKECDNEFVLSWVYIAFTLNVMEGQPSWSLGILLSLAVKSKEIEDRQPNEAHNFFSDWER